MHPLERRPPFRLHPELDLFELPETERAHRLMEAKSAAARPQRRQLIALRIGGSALGLSAMAAAWLAGWLWTTPVGWRSGVAFGLWSLLFASIATTTYFITSFWLLRNRVRRQLRRELIRRGVPVCVSCGYDLRGLVRTDPPPPPWPQPPANYRFVTEPDIEAQCPECGGSFANLLKINQSKEVGAV